VHILVRVDPKKCMANQRCSAEAPGLFELGPDGAARITRRDATDFTAADLPALVRARDECPTGAIHLETLDETDAD
jgi:ferredoxin